MCNVTAAYKIKLGCCVFPESPHITGNLQYVLTELGRSFLKVRPVWQPRHWHSDETLSLPLFSALWLMFTACIYNNVLALPDVQYLEKAMRSLLQVSVELFGGKDEMQQREKGDTH